MKLFEQMGKKRRIVVWFVSVALFFLTFSFLTYGIFSLVVSPESDNGTIRYKHGTGSKRDSFYEVDKALYCPNGIYYVDFSTIQKGCDFSVSGDENEIRYIIAVENGRYDTVTFYYGSRQAVINGSHFMLSAPVVKTGKSVLVPADLIMLCMNGITVETTKDSITVVYDPQNISLKTDIKPMTPIEP